MDIARLGEQALISRVDSVLSDRLGARADVLVGIGDDAALVRTDGPYQLLKTDQQVEGVHFQRAWAPAADVGWKALAVSISDIAAMGGVPAAALVALVLPADVPVEWVDDLYAGMAAAAAAYGVAIVGGDTSAGPAIAATVMLTGTPTASGADGTPRLLLRSRARAGDVIAVTGTLGGAAGGLRAVNGEGDPLRMSDADRDRLVRALLHPTPRVAEGRRLVAEGVVAAIDVSDGLVGDLERMCAASGVAATLEAWKLPVDPALAASFSPAEARMLALTGGEDYELLFAAPAETVRRVRAATETPVTVIGRIVEGPAGQVRVRDERGGQVPIVAPGWRHF